VKEYVFKISARSYDRPLAETMILEFGCDAAKRKGLVDAVGQFAELLRMLGTPEAVADFMRTNGAALPSGGKVIAGV
jgi:hypothetical protein